MNEALLFLLLSLMPTITKSQREGRGENGAEITDYPEIIAAGGIIVTLSCAVCAYLKCRRTRQARQQNGYVQLDGQNPRLQGSDAPRRNLCPKLFSRSSTVPAPVALEPGRSIQSTQEQPKNKTRNWCPRRNTQGE